MAVAAAQPSPPSQTTPMGQPFSSRAPIRTVWAGALWHRTGNRHPPECHTDAILLRTGGQISAQDTVPYCLWCAAHHLNNYETAIWVTVTGLGDRDTTCAIVGGYRGVVLWLRASWLVSAA